MSKEELQKLLLEALGKREYFRIKFNNAFLGYDYSAEFHEWDRKVDYLKELLEKD